MHAAGGQRVHHGLDDDLAVRHLPAQVRDDAEHHAPAAGLGQGPIEGQGPVQPPAPGRLRLLFWLTNIIP